MILSIQALCRKSVGLYCVQKSCTALKVVVL